MLRPDAPDLKVYLHRAPIDMRKYAQNIVMRTTRWCTRIWPRQTAFNGVHNGERFWRVSAWRAACLAP